jgi:hypothetical protein
MACDSVKSCQQGCIWLVRLEDYMLPSNRVYEAGEWQ